MTEPTITCPKCGSEIRLTESLAAPLIAATRLGFERQLQEKDAQLEGRLQAERKRIAAEESGRARRESAADLESKARELADLQAVLAARSAKLAEAQAAQADLIRKQRELEDARREIDLTVEKRIEQGLEAVRSRAQKDAEDALRHKVLEKDQTIVSMQRTIEELKQKAERGSQQLQGEVQELALESLLRARFPQDGIDPVPKGEFGGDIVQWVRSQTGQPSGAILWEVKRTRNWSDGWLPKLREDQRAAKAEIAILVSDALPKGVENFEIIDGVWVAHPRCVLPVATVLRHTLLEVALARQASAGQQSKTDMVYQYLTGPRFRQRVEAIVEAFSAMKEDLDKERRVIMKQWAKREEQIERVIGGTVGMYGDLQGIAGKSLREIEGLELRTLSLDRPDSLPGG
jgi:hypothetical protein